MYEIVEERWTLQPCGPEKGHCPGLPEVEPSLPSYIVDTADIDTRLGYVATREKDVMHMNEVEIETHKKIDVLKPRSMFLCS